MFADRLARVRAAMGEQGVDVLFVSVGSDLPYLVGYEAMPLERLTMLVIPRDGDVSLVVPGLEVARVVPRPDVFGIVPWGETENPVSIVAELAGPAGTAAIGDQTWARFLIELGIEMPGTTFIAANDVLGPIRASKDDAEIAALHRAGDAADRVATQLQSGQIPLIGRTEADVSADISRRLLDEGHERVNFAIVASGPNAASPHHHAGSRVIEAGEVVLCDFGGVFSEDDHLPGYCSDITRTVWTGTPPTEVSELYGVLHTAQQAALNAVAPGVACQEIDRVARRIITDGGYGDYFIHRTGHGIGLEEHEDPYIVEGNDAPLEAGHAFSIEPGIYVPDTWGFRLEDIVACGDDGADPMNSVDHGLASVEA